jgi:hypothetical protein
MEKGRDKKWAEATVLRVAERREADVRGGGRGHAKRRRDRDDAIDEFVDESE